MANHCYNYATFTGAANKVALLVEALTIEETKEVNLGNKNNCLENLVSLWSGNYGLIVTGHSENYKQPEFDVYDVYGSKWFECCWDYEPGRGQITLLGDSAWSPVLPFFIKLCKAYNLQCEGEYSESGMDFAGTFVIDSEGNVEENQMSYREYEAEHNPGSFWQEVIYSIEDGQFEDFESVISYFQQARWEVVDYEIEELQKTFNKYLDTVKNG